MPKKFWKIHAFDGQKEIEVATLPRGKLSESEMETLLQRLAARHLSDSEVVAASLRKRAKGHSSVLEVTRNRSGKYALMILDGSPQYTATIGNG